MKKFKNLTLVEKEKDNPLFVSEILDDRKIYVVSQKEFDDPHKKTSDLIECLVLEYFENQDEFIYKIKKPETQILLKRGELQGILTQ